MNDLWSSARPHLLRSIFLLAPVVVSVLFWALGTGLGVLAGLGAVSGGGSAVLAPEIHTGLTLIGLVGTAFFGLVWVVSLFLPVRETTSEAGRLIDGGAESLAAVHDSIRGHLEQRCPPYRLRAGELDGSPSLSVQGEGAEALVVSRAVGPDLRVAWTVWRNRATSALILDVLAGKRGQNLALLDADAGVTLDELVRVATEHAGREHAR